MGILRIKNHDNVVYSPLQQNISDDDDSEDQIIFNKDLNITPASRNGVKKFSNNVIELDNLPGSKLKRRDPHRAGQSSCCRITKRAAIVLFVILVITIFVVAILHYKSSSQHSPCQTTSKEWNLSFGNNVSDSCIRLLDMDNDGQLDILLSLAAPDYYHHYHSSMDTDNQQPVNEFCNDTGLSYPPTGQLLAIRGCDGKQLWKHSTKSSILYIHCDQLDANQDGKHDCLISGYHATLQAIDPRKGLVIWSANSTYLIDHWNIYQALVVPDVDHDNVDDVLILHAGCCYYGRQPPDITGRFLLFSGATGQAVGTLVDISIMKGAVYRNPVLYKSSNNKLTVLFTSGQLSSSGQLYQIYWDVLKKQLLDPSVVTLSNATAIYESQTKGIFVPPVIVDIQNNNVMDILVSAFDGTIALVDGQTFTPKWKINFTNYESFSIPAPGYFNDDAYLDFMLHLNFGTWPLYLYSMVMVISGKDGTVLWETVSSFPSFTSDLTLQTVEHQRDVFVFKTFNRDGYIHVDSKDPAHIISTDSVVEHRSDPDSTYLPQNHPGFFTSPAGYFLICTLTPQSAITEEVFIMDRSNLDKPIQLAENKYSYSPSPSKAGIQCAVAKPFGRGTGAIGDVDGDNQPDYISLTNLAIEVPDSKPGCPIFWQNMTLYKKTLMPSSHSRKSVPIKMFTSLVNEAQGGEQHEKGLESTHFVPQREQVWNEYLGSKQTGIYRRQHLSDGGNTMSRRSRVLYYLVVLFTLLVVLL
ncbi:protein FAM234B-like [Octopus sinensis]|uniref:Protein FAM234B-like n=1 Tax=Octopus sinensis TaxID=2607531 RepID=A0A6P7TQQ7_9MOLL|nr:protein FAM234B-like [Octopus sinensis]